MSLRPSVTSNGNISTSDYNSQGIRIYTRNSATISSTGNISTIGGDSDGIYAWSHRAADITSIGTVSTVGDSSKGIYVYSLFDNAAVNSTGDISTQGANATGIDATGYTGVNVTSTGTISTAGNYSNAIFATSDYGVASVNSTGDLSTAGNYAEGVFTSGTSGANVTSSGNISTIGTYSDGIFASNSQGDVTINSTGNISTMGTTSPGIQAFAFTAGDATITSMGNITTVGDYSEGILSRTENGLASVMSTGDIATQGLYSHGIYAYADTTGNAVVTSNGDISTLGNGAHGVYAHALDGSAQIDATGDVSTQGDNAKAFFARSDFSSVNVTVMGDISTLGYNSEGIDARSSTGSLVSFSGTLTTEGERSEGIIASTSNGNTSVDASGAISTSGMSSAAIRASSRETTTVTSDATISTSGDSSSGISASGSVLAEVTSNGTVSTSGNSSTGISASSSDTAIITSNAAISTSGSNSSGIRVSGSELAMATSNDTITTMGDSAAGISASSFGGTTDITSNAAISTQGYEAYGILSFALAGTSTVTSNADITTVGDSAGGIVSLAFTSGILGSSGPSTVVSSGNIMTSGENALGIVSISSADVSTVTSTGNISTTGDYSSGILAGSTYSNAQVTSSGSITTSGLGSMGITAASLNDGDVMVTTSGDITTSGADASGIYGYTVGGAITMDVQGGTISGGSGTGAAIELVGGTSNMVTNRGTLSALSGNAIIGGAGDDHIWNYGTIIGNIDLDGGSNVFHNHTGGIFNMGAMINLGAGGQLINDGTLSPGGDGVISTTAITGDLVQNAAGILAVDIDAGTGATDLIQVSGSASLAGTIVPTIENLTNTPQEFTILTAAGGTTDNGVALGIADTLLIDYSLLFPNANDVVIGYTVNLAGLGETPNQTEVANYLNNGFTTGGTLGTLVSSLSSIGDKDSFLAALDRLYPEVYLVNAFNSAQSSVGLADIALNCDVKARYADYTGSVVSASSETGHSTDDYCLWAEGFGGVRDWDRGINRVGHDDEFWGLRGGGQVALGERWRAGLAVSYEDIDTDLNNWASSEGHHVQVAASAATRWSGLDLGLAVQGGWGSFDATRPLDLPVPGDTAFGEQDVMTLGARLHIASTLHMGDYYFRPSLGFGVAHVDSDGLRESRGDVASLDVGSFDETFFNVNPEIEFGGNFAFANGVNLAPYMSLGALTYSQDEISTSSRFVGAPDDLDPFQTVFELDDVVGQLSAGANVQFSETISLGIRYDGALSDNHDSHQGSLRMRIGL